MRRAIRALALLVGSSGVAIPVSGTAQAGPPVAALSSDTVALGEVFELRVLVPVPPGSIVAFPDSVARSDILESFSAVAWRAEPSPGGGAELTLTYSVIAFRAGEIPVPGIDVYLSPVGTPTGGDALPGGSVIREWSTVPRGPSDSRFISRVPRREVWVEPVFTLEDFERGVEPMPADDVVGSSWSWPSVALMLLFASVLGGTVVTTTRDWLSARDQAPGGTSDAPLTPSEARARALDELDRLLTAELHTSGRTHEFYTRSSTIVRDYLERLDPAWRRALTSNEVMGLLVAARVADASDAVVPEMLEAEVVKFGRRRPEASSAEHHLHILRRWVDASGGGSA